MFTWNNVFVVCNDCCNSISQRSAYVTNVFCCLTPVSYRQKEHMIQNYTVYNNLSSIIRHDIAHRVSHRLAFGR
ncbi:hypothetical protein MT325_M023L [Paramecium bursaria chlorella virus MT325]|uniref:Uncharacterized protein M023L n=1 Tax=Paramecium bursaria Chlorella virus MT325 TaxID=346932 RepID=A7ITA3_PBCVM|nr:hypothetical protein MT325_M023L [Paramecium bursaria chlorella virus MT325]